MNNKIKLYGLITIVIITIIVVITSIFVFMIKPTNNEDYLVAPTPVPTQPYEELTEQEQGQIQVEADKNTADWFNDLYTNFPWYDKQPLQTDSYFVYFDVESRTFKAQDYTNQQSDALKQQILEDLLKNGIPATSFPFEWE